MRIVAAIAVAVSLGSFSVNADVGVSAAAAVQFTKKSRTAETENTIDGAFVRGEVKAGGTLEKSGLTGLIHLRIQPDMGGGTKGIDLQPRQVFFNLPVSILEIMAGRWYDKYGPGYGYFGRYLHGVNAMGSGSMNTNYTVVDGLKLKLNIDAIKSAFHVYFLPVNSGKKDEDGNEINDAYHFEDIYLLAMFGGSPVEGLKFNIGGNFEVFTPDWKDKKTHRFITNAGYTIVKDLGLGLFGEFAIVDFEEPVDNMWFLAGFTTKAGVVLDRIQAEFEIKNHRNKKTSTDANLAWMVLLQKKVMGLTFDLNVGADPKSLESKTVYDVGAILRVTAKF